LEFLQAILMHYETKFLSIAGLRFKILTGPNEKANDLAFDKEPDEALASPKGE